MNNVFPIKASQDWTFDQVDAVYHELEKIAVGKYGLDCYPNQIEVVSSEQMLDAYSSVGMPVMYKHWSFGKSFVQNYKQYMTGKMGLAYELVINSSPCVNYLMEENSAMMQTLVIAHAAFGHNSFFKGNHLFKQWTDAEAIVDYLVFANDYIAKCEDRYGWKAVEEVLDAAHALQNYGVDKYKRTSTKQSKLDERMREREEHKQAMLDLVLEKTTPKWDQLEGEDYFDPEENLLYFIEKNAFEMPTWKCEILRIVRKIAQYFYPQRLTKVMNEGWATFWHYTLIHDLREAGLVDEGFMLEFYESHCGVVWQHPKSHSINPYALGFAMFQDIKRVCMEPTDEDRLWFGSQSWVGCGDWLKTITWAMQNFKDESFIRQFLTPKVMRDFGFFKLVDDDREDEYIIAAIHNDAGYREVRDTLAEQHTNSTFLPEIAVTGVRRMTDRALELTHYMANGRPLDLDETMRVMQYIEQLWGFPVELKSMNGEAVYSTVALNEGVPSVSLFYKE